MDDRYEPMNIDVERDKGVTLTYVDGYVVSFDLVTLRGGCPCATCRGLRDQGDEVWPRPDSPTPLRIEDARLHGAWGLAITWNDGHATGIFPFELLRSWHERGVIDWLLEGDPAIRWQVLRDLTDASPDEVAAERARVEHEGWGARLLALEDGDGLWEGGACFPAAYTGGEPGQPWTATMHSLQTLQICGLDPASAAARRAIALVAEHGRWEHAGQRYFDGEVEPCINGRTIETGAYFGLDVAPIVELVLGERLADGGWNCEVENGSVRSSFDTTIDVLDGLLEFERATGGSAMVSEARRGGEQYLLERGLFRRKSTGEIVNPAYLDFAFPYYWRYDVLRALDYFRLAGAGPDPRMAEAVEVVRSKRQPDGRWLLDRIHPGRVHFDLEDGVGSPSRWNTLRALRVLDWWDRGASPVGD